MNQEPRPATTRAKMIPMSHGDIFTPAPAAAATLSDSEVDAVEVAVVVTVGATIVAGLAEGLAVVAGAGVGLRVGVVLTAIVTVALPCVPLNMFLLCESYAAESEFTRIVADPLSLALNVAVPNFFTPVKPPTKPAVSTNFPFTLSIILPGGVSGQEGSITNPVASRRAAGYETLAFTV